MIKYALPIKIIAVVLLLSGCQPHDNSSIHFATSADYPPFEFAEQSELKGFDIDLAHLIAAELGKKAVIDNMQFSSVLPALTSGQDEAAISTLTITKVRQRNFDFSAPYYFQEMAAVYKTNAPVISEEQLVNKKIAVQLGSVMDLWVHTQFTSQQITAFDNNNQAIEALKGNHMDVVVMDAAQALVFSKKNPGLAYHTLGQSKQGYGVALPKGSPLTAEINKALNILESKGEIARLKAKWLEK
ncbi:amino acid (glutamine) ABC transporter periplasmic amino acid binding protein [Legionella quinlivanii]|uniref:Amino acid (Glutamine) ABC transporter periplasmic amino acid binding protein n=1 Tax=Legionella quinlivanii TaxID=45073 RepID=A0A0W0Y3U3_9GAMM|nr:ABC transporter substrate-binding protein [Legionella quinlivanii]KTD51624.1 amino acid (glutamine) ABC transporter periplasmic amino acid binding protein [Legionella quinlivanii]SEF61103.1 amino acid ABC transporter substrate-binding protein, PAAT family (TC 3.A.1.3.-) [Legionella quinlivanii DSM 21216]STY10849.1 amino acid (glutamine) ABC transporter, periplasmic amino acid binding protein [Legionella quinlivanii]